MKNSKKTILGIVLLFLFVFELPAEDKLELMDWGEGKRSSQRIQSALSQLEQSATLDPNTARNQLHRLKPDIAYLNQPYLWGKYFQVAGKIAIFQKQNIRASRCFFTALSHFDRLQHGIAAAETCLELGELYTQYNNNAQALEYCRMGLSILEKNRSKNPALEVEILTQITLNYLSIQNNAAAQNALTKAKKLAQFTASPAQKCELLRLSAILYRALGKQSDAYQTLKSAYNIAQKHHLHQKSLMILENLSKYGSFANNLDIAIHYGKQYRKLAAAEKDTVHLISSDHRLGKLYLTQNKIDSARIYTQFALQNLKSISKYDTLYRTVWVLNANLMERMGKPDAAILALDSALVYHEKNNEDTEQQNRQWEEMTIARAKEEMKSKADTELEKQGKFRNALFIAIGIAVVFVLFFGLRAAQKQRANLLLNEQNSQIAEQKKELEFLNQIKNQLFTIISHDLRGPVLTLQEILNAINEMDRSAAERKWWLEMLHQQTARANVMLENLLFWANLQMRHYQPVYTTIDLLDLAEELKENVQLMHLDKKAIIVLHIPDGFSISTDSEMLRIALRNILINAIKFSDPQQNIEMSARLENDTVYISIKDEGIGMNDEQLNRALKGQYAREGTKGEIGSGIGLSLVRQFLELQGGKLLGESQPNKGTTFTIVLPITKVATLN
jgi:signal transduction histidine kinase